MGIKMTPDRRHFSSLKLDDRNPRLPEEYQGSDQVSLMRVFYRNYDLDELASSYVKNGFFDAEALIIVDDGTVIEGNRRLAALKYLLHDKDAEQAELPLFPEDELESSAPLESLEEVPVYVADTRDELMAYLGFHHINGPMQWPPASKARYVFERVESIADAGLGVDPFFAVSKEIGSNTMGVRNVYRQYGLLKVARDHLGLQQEANSVLNNRFGVWARLTSSATVFDYIGFHPDGTDYVSIRSALNNYDAYDKARFKLLLNDMIPSENGQAVLNDSRRATAYARIITDEKAVQTLRVTRNYETALFIADKGLINDKLIDVRQRLDSISDDLENGAMANRETKSIVSALRSKLSAILGQVNLYLEDHPEEADE